MVICLYQLRACWRRRLASHSYSAGIDFFFFFGLHFVLSIVHDNPEITPMCLRCSVSPLTDDAPLSRHLLCGPRLIRADMHMARSHPGSAQKKASQGDNMEAFASRWFVNRLSSPPTYVEITILFRKTHVCHSTSFLRNH